MRRALTLALEQGQGRIAEFALGIASMSTTFLTDLGEPEQALAEAVLLAERFHDEVARPPERDQSVVGFAQVPKRTYRNYLQRYHSVSHHGPPQCTC